MSTLPDFCGFLLSLLELLKGGVLCSSVRSWKPSSQRLRCLHQHKARADRGHGIVDLSEQTVVSDICHVVLHRVNCSGRVALRQGHCRSGAVVWKQRLQCNHQSRVDNRFYLSQCRHRQSPHPSFGSIVTIAGSADGKAAMYAPYCTVTQNLSVVGTALSNVLNVSGPYGSVAGTLSNPGIFLGANASMTGTLTSTLLTALNASIGGTTSSVLLSATQ